MIRIGGLPVDISWPIHVKSVPGQRSEHSRDALRHICAKDMGAARLDAVGYTPGAARCQGPACRHRGATRARRRRKAEMRPDGSCGLRDSIRITRSKTPRRRGKCLFARRADEPWACLTHRRSHSSSTRPKASILGYSCWWKRC